ncbi:MAG: DNA-binding transcriptional regulator [Tepidisphaeraceae bacterium]
MALPKHKRVALVIDSMTAPRRTMMSGIARFMQEHEPWSIYLKPPFIEAEIDKWLQTWRGDGVLGRLTAQDAIALKRAGLPFVDVAGVDRAQGGYLVRANDRRIGQVGAEHLLERGFKSFAFFEIVNAFWARHRFEGFSEVVQKAGFEAQRYVVDKPSARPAGPEHWDQQQCEIGHWIAALPKPVGIMTTTDFLGRQVLEACLRIGVSVPEAVAVLGADNDEPMCRISTPPLSSVIINDEQRGYESARLLSELMNGKTPARQTVLIDPSGVFVRASTDVLAIEDETMVLALRYLRENVEHSLSVDRLVDELGVSRSTLDRRFRRLLGRSVNDEIVRLRINHAVRLLSETHLPLKAIAQRCGFSSQAYMSTVFSAKLRRTPSSYRR